MNYWTIIISLSLSLSFLLSLSLIMNYFVKIKMYWTFERILFLSLSFSLNVKHCRGAGMTIYLKSFFSPPPLYKTFLLLSLLFLSHSLHYSDIHLQLCGYIDSTWLGCLLARPDNFGVLYFQGVTAYLWNKPQNLILVYNQHNSHIETTK